MKIKYTDRLIVSNVEWANEEENLFICILNIMQRFIINFWKSQFTCFGNVDFFLVSLFGLTLLQKPWHQPSPELLQER